MAKFLRHFSQKKTTRWAVSSKRYFFRFILVRLGLVFHPVERMTFFTFTFRQFRRVMISLISLISLLHRNLCFTKKSEIVSGENNLKSTTCIVAQQHWENKARFGVFNLIFREMLHSCVFICPVGLLWTYFSDPPFACEKNTSSVTYSQVIKGWNHNRM